MAYNMNSPIIQDLARKGVLYGQAGCPVGQPAQMPFNSGMSGPQFVYGSPPTVQTVREPVYVGQGLGQQPMYIQAPAPTAPQNFMMPQPPQYNLFGMQAPAPSYGYPTGQVPIAQAGYSGMVATNPYYDPNMARQGEYKYGQNNFGGFNNMGNNLGYYGQQAYFNPYLYQDMIKKYQEQAQQRAIFEMNLNKSISRSVHDYFGDEVTDDQIDYMYNPQRRMAAQQPVMTPIRMEFIQTQQNIDMLNMMHHNQYTPQIQQAVASDYVSLILPVLDCNKYVSQDCGMLDFFKQAGNLYREMKLAESRKQEHDMSQLYDHASYQQQLHMKFPAFAKEFDQMNLSSDFKDQLAKSMMEGKDALYITVPQHLASKYEERKAAFMQRMIERSD